MPPASDWLVKPLAWTTKNLSQSLQDWWDLLDLPRAPLFAANTNFTQQEGKLIRVLLLCTACASIALGNDNAHGFSLTRISPEQMKWLVWIVFAAILYILLAGFIFRISLSPRQAVFVFAFTLLPYVPIMAVVHIMGDHWPVGGIFLIVFWIMLFRTLWSMTIGISAVSKAGKIRCLASLTAPVVLGVGLWMISSNFQTN
jgi:hypothetical protein